MSEFKVSVEKIEIESHPNADALELAKVGDYRSIVKRGQYKTGDLVAYIPEQAVVPENILNELGLTGRLAGKDKNRVKAIKLRGILSQGICYPAKQDWFEGQDVTSDLGIIKWEPPIPAQLAGEVWNAGSDKCIKYDVENLKRHPDILQEGEQVVFTEKVHGTWCQLGVMEDDTLVVTSKGLGAKGLAFKENEKNYNNLYLRVARHLNITERVRKVYTNNQKVFVLGEIFGKGVQDLSYGSSTDKDDTLGFRVFDIYVGNPGKGWYESHTTLVTNCAAMNLDMVPVLYCGPFSKEVVEKYTSGKETISGKEQHIREGIVIRPVQEKRHDKLGRVQLKSVSEDYLLRKGGTEYN